MKIEYTGFFTLQRNDCDFEVQSIMPVPLSLIPSSPKLTDNQQQLNLQRDEAHEQSPERD